MFLCALSLPLSLSVLLWMLTDAVVSIGLHSHTHSLSLSVSPLPCLSLVHLKGAATPQTGSFEIQISLYPVLIISKVTPTRKFYHWHARLKIHLSFGKNIFDLLCRLQKCSTLKQSHSSSCQSKNNGSTIFNY